MGNRKNHVLSHEELDDQPPGYTLTLSGEQLEASAAANGGIPLRLSRKAR